jgi:RNA recognition motif-containing protein
MNQTYDVHMNQSLDITKEPYFGFDQDVNTLFIKSVPRLISRYDIRSVVEKVEGYKYLTMSDPVKKNNLKRFCWIEFNNSENCNKAVLSLSGLMIKNETLLISKSITKVKRVKILKNYPTTRQEADIDTLLRLIIKMDEEVGIQDNRLIEREFNSLQAKFDTFLLYLRKVHAYDYFTSTMYEN